jgi:Fe2+ transport system protein FeoA
LTAQSSQAQAAPLLNALLGCERGAMRPKETRGVRVAPDAAKEHAASSDAERSGTLAEAAAPPRAQARRESSRRGAQHSCYPLVDRCTRQLRGQRAAWRRSAAQKRLRCSRTSEACRGSERQREQPGAIQAVQNESHTTQGVSTAHRRLFNTGLQAGRLFAVPHVEARNAHDAAQSRLQTLGGHRATILRLTARDEGGTSVQICGTDHLNRSPPLIKNGPPIRAD